MKKKSGKNLVRFFYHLLVVLFMAMPLMSTLFRCVYVAHNKNAFESYYGETINETEVITLDNINEIQVNKRYTFTNYYQSLNSAGGTGSVSNNYIAYTDLTLDIATNDNSINETIKNSVRLGFYKVDGNTYMSFFFYNNLGSYSSISSGIGIFSISFTVTNVVYNTNILDLYNTNVLETFIYNDYSYLDNAFEYSIYKELEQDKDMVLIDFTGFNNGVFIDYGDNIYMEFANFYIGWVLNCAVISFVPYVLLSFFNLAISLIDKFTFRKGD